MKSKINYNKRGQVTIFIILAIVIIGGVLIFYTFRENLGFSKSNIKFSEVYSKFDECIKQATLEGLSISGTQGGYIKVPEFLPGSKYAPFSSQFNFLGNPVPYWYYISSNNIAREQVPTINLIQRQLADFIDSEIGNCDFSEFRQKGYLISLGKTESKIVIFDNNIRVDVNADLSVIKGETNFLKSSHQVEVDSKFGKFFNLAKEIYSKQKKEAFLENYSIDVMMSYAPVTGVEISCSPMIWKPSEVAADLKDGLSANIGNLKVNGNYYTLNNKDNKYFIVKGIETDEIVRFVYLPEWPTRVEIWPVESSLMISRPVGLEAGMGILGFCYVPYHFTYDIYYPVLIQITDNKELFQFPFAVVIDKSVPRYSNKDSGLSEGADVSDGSIDELCNYKNTRVDVYTFDKELSPIKADISFACFNTACDIGQTEIQGIDAKLISDFPQCINGKITAKSEGYVDQSYMISTNEPTSANILMDKLYDLDVKLFVDGKEFSSNTGMALIGFESEKNTFFTSYLDQKKAKLSEAYYNVSVLIYGGSALVVPASSSRQCVDTIAPGIMGIFGKKNEQCFDINIPEQKLDNALIAGGKSSIYILESDLKNSKKLKIFVRSLPSPNSLDRLQQNYELLEKANIELRFE